MTKLKLFLIMWLVTFFSSLHGQFKVSGKISSAHGLVSFAAVDLTSTDGNLKTLIQSDSTGAFAFNDLRKGNYSITVSHIGFTPYSSTFQINRDTVITILLAQQTNELNQVIVQGSKATLERSP